MTPISRICAAVKAELPGTMVSIRHVLGLTHEQVHAALVRLSDQGAARYEPRYIGSRLVEKTWARGWRD